MKKTVLRMLCAIGFHSGRETHADGHGIAYGYTPCSRCGR
jgi:hypothetical protein